MLNKIVYKTELDYAGLCYGYSIRWILRTFGQAWNFRFVKLMLQLFQIHIYSFCVANKIYHSH